MNDPENASQEAPDTVSSAPAELVALTEAQEDMMMQRFGFMADAGSPIPDDFDRMFEAEVEDMYGLNDQPNSATAM